MKTLPTPYDIQQIAPFADQSVYQPWLLLLLLLLMFILTQLIRRLRSRPTPAGERNLFALADKALRDLAQQAESEQDHGDLTAQAGLVVKRLLSELEDVDFSALSPRELSEIVSGSTDARLRPVLERIYDFDMVKYSGAAAPADPAAEIRQLRDLLAGYCRQPQAEAE